MPSHSLIEGEGLALSGGGFRSTLFQTGVIIRFNELGMLPKLRCISSVSGGSLTSGLLAVKWGKLRFENSIAANLTEEFVSPLIDFCNQSIDEKTIISGILSPFKSAADELASALDEGLFKGKKLIDLPDTSVPGNPRFVLNATNLHTGVRFWFSREDIGDWRLGYTRAQDIPVARAVAASGAFPPFYVPMSVDVSQYQFQPCLKDEKPISDLLHDKDLHQTIECADGGAYDNLALGAIWDTYSTLWVSDASGPFESNIKLHHDYLRIMMRIIDIMMRSGEAKRRQDLIALFRSDAGMPPQRAGTYWSTITPIENYRATGYLHCDPTKTRPLAEIGTRYTKFKEEIQQGLINWGYALSDAGVRRNKELPNAPPPTWPYPKHPL